MVRLGCRDLGLDCDFVAEADNPEDVKKTLLNHGLSVHMSYLFSLTKQQQQDLLKKADELLKKQ